MMSGIYRYSILKDHNLIILVLQDDITFDGLKKIRKKVSEDKNFNPECKFLADVRLSRFDANIKDVKEFGEWFFKNSKMKSQNKKVFLTNNPDQVVKSIVFTTISMVFNFKIFSTLMACLKHLEIDSFSLDVIEKEIEIMI